MLGYLSAMKLMRSAVAIGVARKIYNEARKPENQRRVKQGIETLRKRQQGRRRAAG